MELSSDEDGSSCSPSSTLKSPTSGLLGRRPSRTSSSPDKSSKSDSYSESEMDFQTGAQRMALSANQVFAFSQVANQRASLKHHFENFPELMSSKSSS